MDEAILIAENVTVGLTAHSVAVVENVSLQLRPSEVLGLVGETGAGKSTLAMALLGYARPGTTIRSGEITVAGQDLLKLPPRQLRKLRGAVVSYVAQDSQTALNPALRVETHIMEALETHGYSTDAGKRRDRLMQVLEDTRLPTTRAFLRSFPHQLSGGQQQRVCLAVAFACRPAVVILDEPTTGLDVSTQAHVLRTVAALCRDYHTAAVYVTHDLAVCATVAQTIAVMYAGEIVEMGPSDDLLTAPRHPYTQCLIRAIPDPSTDSVPVGIRGRVAPLGSRPAGCAFASRCDYMEKACTEARIEPTTVARTHEVRCRRHELVVREWQTGNSMDSLTHRREVTHRGNGFLEVKALAAGYGKRQVISEISLAISQGECLGLVGESGSGKTTISRCIAGLHQGATGEMTLRGEALPLKGESRLPSSRRAIQYIFQNPYSSLNPRKTVRQLIEQPLRVFGVWPQHEWAERVSGHLVDVALDPSVANRYPAQLSGGERQRVAIARALAAEPELLICDEITSALDVSVQASVIELLGRLRRSTNLTLLFVTHNLPLVRGVADEVVVLRDGRVVESGPAEEVLTTPHDAYTMQLLTDTPRWSPSAAGATS